MKKLISVVLVFLLAGFISAAQQEKMPITSSSGSAVKLYHEATAALENTELARGEALLEEALKKDPEFFMGLFQKAIINLYAGNQQKFKKSAESAFISYCAFSEGEKILQEALKRLYENPKADATDLGRKLIQLYPGDKLVYCFQLTFQTIQKDYPGIRETCNSLLEITDNPAYVYNMMGYNNMRLNDFEAAEKAFDKYIELKPNRPNSYDSKGDYFMEVKDYPNAWTSYMTANRLDESWSYEKAINAKKLMGAETVGFPNQFRGNNCCGVAPAGANPPVSLLADENLAWKTEIASGVSSPCVWENSIFLTGYEPYDRFLTTYCIDKKTGAVLWEKSILPDGIEPVHPIGSPAAATPVTDGKYVYAYFGSYGVICYDFEGNLVWEKKLPVPKTRYGSCASPVILENKLILNRFEVNNPVVLALEPSTGETIWKTKLSGIPGLTESLQRSQSTPVLWNDQIILHRSLALSSVNINDGKENWTIGLVSMGSSTPVIVDDVLYVNGFTNLGEARLYDELPDFDSMLTKYDANRDSLVQFEEIPESLAFFKRPDLDLPLNDTLYSWNQMAPSFDGSQDKALNEQEWKGMEQYLSMWYEKHGVVAVDLKNAGKPNKSEFLWKENEFIAEVPSLLCAGNQVYMVSNGGTITCMETETGEVVYREKLGAPGAYIASPLLAGGHIYFVSYNGRITVVKPDVKLNVVSQCDLKEKIAASPVASDNQLFVRTTKSLYAFVE